MRSKLSVITPTIAWFPRNVHAFSTTRIGGFSNVPYDGGNGHAGLNLGDHVGDDPHLVALNREILDTCLPSSIKFLSQLHGVNVADASDLEEGQVADACFTSKKNLVCAVLTADCLPVLFSNASGTVVAAAHAGWRGLALGVLQETVRVMRESASDEIYAWLGPAIGPTKFEVGRDVLDAFSSLNASDCFIPTKMHGKYLADIYSLAKLAMAEVGVFRIDGGEHCTFTERDRFFSYRRDRATGRMASVIWMD